MKVLVLEVDYKKEEIVLGVEGYFRPTDIATDGINEVRILNYIEEQEKCYYGADIPCATYIYKFKNISGIKTLKQGSYLINKGYKIEESMREQHLKTSTKSRPKKEFIPDPTYITTNWEDIKYTAAYLGVQESVVIFAKEQTKTNRRETIYNWIKRQKWNKGNADYYMNKNKIEPISLLPNGLQQQHITMTTHGNNVIAGKMIRVYITELQDSWLNRLIRRPRKFMLELKVTGILHEVAPKYYNALLGVQSYDKCEVRTEEV